MTKNYFWFWEIFCIIINILQRNWNSVQLEDGVKFYITSPDGDEGFPGSVYIEAIYRLSEKENKITIEFRANTTRDTPIDLSNHAYFNLAGHYSREKIYNHFVKIYADSYLDFDKDEITVTGNVNSVVNTKYDFRYFYRLGDRIRENSAWPEDGYDNYFVSNQQTGNRIIASIKNPSNGISLDIYSNQNGAQFYTGNFLNVTKRSEINQVYSIHQGFCFAPHNFPDAVNKVIFLKFIKAIFYSSC
jgi:aldose 1-epimerase